MNPMQMATFLDSAKQSKAELNKILAIDETCVHTVLTITVKNVLENKTSKISFVCLAAIDRISNS